MLIWWYFIKAVSLQDISDMKLEVEGEEVGGQILPHFYCEDMMNVMNKVRMMMRMMTDMKFVTSITSSACVKFSPLG